MLSTKNRPSFPSKQFTQGSQAFSGLGLNTANEGSVDRAVAVFTFVFRGSCLPLPRDLPSGLTKSFWKEKVQSLFACLKKNSAAERPVMWSLLYKVTSHQLPARLALCHALPAMSQGFCCCSVPVMSMFTLYFNASVIERVTSLSSLFFVVDCPLDI